MTTNYETVIYTTPPAADLSQTLVVGAGGTLDVSAGTLLLGTVALPNLPTGNGTYHISITSGVATWVSG